MIHTFAPDEEFLCKEVLYVADERLESHYAKKHIRNSGVYLGTPANNDAWLINTGAEVQADIVVNMTFLKTSNLIEINHVPGTKRKAPRSYYEVVLDLVMRVDGRTLVVEAIWPPLADGETLDEVDPCRVRESKRHSIAAAFLYGTE